MKKFLTLTIFAALFVSCSTEIFDIEEDGATHFLKLNTIAEKGNIEYPIDLYAYSEDIEKEHITISSAEETPEFNLPAGTYTVYAVCGSTDFSKGYSTEPLMTGKTTVTLGKTDLTEPLTLKYAVARLIISLSDVPETATGVSVKIDSLYSSIDVKGELSAGRDITLQCQKKDDLWATDTVYILPSNTSSVAISVNHQLDANTSKNFSYIYPAPILAGHPYNFKGSYTSGITMAKLSLAVDIEGWGEEKECSFAFGEGANKDDYVTPSDASIFHVNELPTACSEWNGHVVATIDEEGNALLFSLEEWSDVSSADEGAENPTQASTIASGYIEANISGWSIPTEEQALMMIELCRTNLKALITSIKNVKGNELKENRLLCNDSFMYYNLFTKKTGQTSSKDKYYLRLVKPVKFILNE